MSTIKDEKIKNSYNALRKIHLGFEVGSPQDPPSQDVKEHEAPQKTPQEKSVAPGKRIKHNSIGESSRKWKNDPLDTRAIQDE